MKRLVAMLLCCAMVFSFTACGSDDKGGNDTQQDSQSGNGQQDSQGGDSQSGDNSQQGGEDQTDNDALSMLTTIWDSFPESGKFMAFGGNMGSPVDGAPGKFDVSDTEGMLGYLLLPESVQSNIDDAASLFHGMMVNNFTGAVIHVTNSDAAGAAAEIKDKIVDNQWVCGFPDKLVVLTAGDYVLYAFGMEEAIDTYASVAKEKISGATEVYNDVLNR